MRPLALGVALPALALLLPVTAASAAPSERACAKARATGPRPRS